MHSVDIYKSRFCHIKTGEVVCDPMCGGGSIPVEVSSVLNYLYKVIVNCVIPLCNSAVCKIFLIPSPLRMCIFVSTCSHDTGCKTPAYSFTPWITYLVIFSFIKQAVLNWPSAVHLCGDIHEHASPRTKENLDALNAKRQEAGLQVATCY